MKIDWISLTFFRGFRTPDLKFTYPTFSYLKDLKFLYDASIPEQSFNPFSPLPTKKVSGLYVAMLIFLVVALHA